MHQNSNIEKSQTLKNIFFCSIILYEIIVQNEYNFPAYFPTHYWKIAISYCYKRCGEKRTKNGMHVFFMN
jgi:hypothetical protein